MASPWDAIELRHLRTLAAVGRTGSFSRAAEDLGYTQPAVSQQVARLESLTGTRLVERPGGPRAVSLTPAGELLVARAETLAGELARARADLEALAAGESGVLRVGCFSSVGVRLLPAALRELSAQRPGMSVRLVEAEDDGDLLDLLEAGRLDVAFVVHPVPPGDWRTIELVEDPYVVVVHDGHPLASRRRPIEPHELDGVPLVTYGEMRSVHAVENRLGRPGLGDQVVLRSHDNGTILALAAEGIGAAVVSWLSVDEHRPGILVLPLRGVAPRVVGLAWHADRATLPAAEAFVALVREAAVAEQARASALLDVVG
ncbi:MAG TPA: LysR family transcriptional regulator [Candidatus Nanopelagicales bacterium]|nr:LysR family transcriptional regulator [Candidatus Nanopelagicales bacterium]